MAEVLVTGAAGFIGSHVCEALLRSGRNVVGLDNFDDFYDPAIKRANIAAAARDPRFVLMEGDIRDAAMVRRLVHADTFAIIHLAARAGVRPSIAAPQLYYDVNLRGTLTLLEACATHKNCRFIFGSSSSVYGNCDRVPFREDDVAGAPISPYAATKRAGELLCHTYHHLHGLPTTCLRFFTVYGPRQRPDLAIRTFAEQIEAGKPITVFGDGSMRRDYTYIDDIVDGILRTVDRCSGFGIYNLGNANPLTLPDLIATIERCMGKQARIAYGDASRGDVNCTYADISLAARDLGYRPRTDLQTGIAHFVDWFRRQPKTRPALQWALRRERPRPYAVPT